MVLSDVFAYFNSLLMETINEIVAGILNVVGCVVEYQTITGICTMTVIYACYCSRVVLTMAIIATYNTITDIIIIGT